MSENIQNLQDASVDAGVPKALNYIEKLVAELCPEGVEYVELGRLGKRNSGTSITAAKMKQIKNPDGEIRIFAAGNNNITAKSNDVPEKDILLGPSIIVKSRGHIGFEYYEGKFTHKSELWSYTLNNGEVNQKYVYYFLLTCSQYLQKLARSKSVKLPQLAVRDTDNLLVPIPPLEMQNAIVDILDKFTKLEAELEAELAARRAQYEYYRNSLFENLSGGGSEILGDLVQYVRDKTKSLMKPLEYVGVENLNVDFQGCTASLSTISGTRYIPSDILLGNIRPYLKKMWISNNEGIAGSDVLVIRIKDEYRNDIVPKFLYYQLTTSRFVDYNVRNSRGGKMPRGNKKKILEFPIFLPPFAEQERIVKILDKFDALVNDISSGLPAEIEARRKQYEYYRDRLLTFPRASDSTEHKQ
ncbi:restriction endonuclease subunit S [Rothia dentocariosa]|uniref:restriction endonuclease subunit S n=1 Tax=Rothia dentocariosa TaxID=2047 RepID=UPI003A86EA4A